MKNNAIPKTMKAVVAFGNDIDHIEVRELPVPEPGPNQLLCRVEAAGVCTSILKLVAQGKNHTFLNGWDPTVYPIILGDEGSLTVVKAGKNLEKEYLPGTRYGIQPAADVGPINHRERYNNNAEGMTKTGVGYTLPGNLAEYILIQEEILESGCMLKLPSDDIPHYAVSMAEPVSCVFSSQDRQVHIVKKDRFSPREARIGLLEGGVTVVIGAGTMGRIHVEMAMRFRPRVLIVSDLVESRLETIRKLFGKKSEQLSIRLDTVQPYALSEALARASDEKGADDVIVAVGIQAVQQSAFSLLAKGGVVNLFGGLPKAKSMLQVDAIDVHYRDTRIVGSSGGDAYDMMATIDLIAKGQIDAGNYIYGIGSLEHVPEVLRAMKEGKVEGRAIIYPHAGPETFTTVDYWSPEDEKKLLS